MPLYRLSYQSTSSLPLSDKTATPEMCAIEIHEDCNKEFVKLMQKDNKICKNADKWFNCYSKALSKGKCTSDVLEKYKDFVEEHGPQLVESAIRMGNLCDKK